MIDPEMVLLRLTVGFVVFSLSWLAYLLTSRLLIKRAGRQTGNLPGYQKGQVALVYFTAPGCKPCHSFQRPAIEQLKATLMEKIQVLEIDVNHHPAIAKAWGVLSLPTIFVLDSTGRPRRVNHGLTSAKKLHLQVEELL